MIEEILQKMQTIMDGAEAESRSLTDDEVTQYEGLEADLAKARKQAELRSRHQAYTTPIGAPAIITARDNGDATEERAFEAYLRTGQKNMDLVEARAQQTGTDSAGGYLAPDGFRQKIVERMKAFGGVATLAEEITTSDGNPLPWVTNDDTANVGEIVAESATGAAGADLVFGTKSLGAYKYMAFGASNLPLRVSVELLQDSQFDIAGMVSRKLGERIARKQASDFAVGTGTGMPQGLMTHATDITLAAGNAITYAKLLDVVHAVDPAYRNSGNAAWLMNDSTLKAVRALTDSTGRPLLQYASDASIGGGLGATLLGFPVVTDPAIAAIALSAKIAAFGDIREGFIIRRVKDVVVVVDPYGRAANGEVQYVAWARADATRQNDNAYAILTCNAA